MWRLVILLCAVVIAQGDEEEWKVIKTPQGPVRGRNVQGLWSFKNIPYATMPKGPRKFTAPLPAPVWVQTLETPEQPIACPQASMPMLPLDGITIQEDCLVANVNVPITDEIDLPVVVYVHGGAFELGYGELLNFKTFVRTHKVIVVTFNYRLGVHGLLCLGTEGVPGNAAFKDQVALLHWVQKNIASYGGNPKDVTIAGPSAGSISVDLLMISKSAQGLFTKVIPESGVNIASIALQSNPVENAKEYAAKLNFTNVNDFSALEEFYRNTPLDKLFISTFLERTDSSLPFSACVERRTSSTAFLTDSPVNIIKTGNYKKVPILLGFSRMEGSIALFKFEDWKHQMNEKFSDFIPADLEFDSEEEKEQVAKSVKEFYFGDNPVSKDTVLAYIDFFSDVFFAYPTLRVVKEHVENGHKEIYLYDYSFVDNSTEILPHTNTRGAPHCAQSNAVMDGLDIYRSDESNITEKFKNLKTTIRQMWYNFMVHGKPVPEDSPLPAWPPVRKNTQWKRSPHMNFGQTVELKGPLLEDRARFWDNIYEKHYRHPSPPPSPMHTEL